MIINAKIAIASFLASWIWIIGLYSFNHGHFYVKLLGAFSFFLIHVALLLKSTEDLFQVIWRAYMLGFFFSTGAAMAWFHLYSLYYRTFGLYFIVLSWFHYGEYLATALFHPSIIKTDAFILNHSREYNIALLLSVVEHALLLYFFPTIKNKPYVLVLGFLGCIAGDTFRKLAMYTAGKNFNHIVEHSKRKDHALVTTGVYAIVRHPSYTGWFCWSVSTQILLCNPICLVGYVIASWKFFKDRIEYEELTLLTFFGDQYVEYKRAVPSGVPFVYGYPLKKDF